MRRDATMTSGPDDRANPRPDQAAQLLAEMRANVEDATRQLDELTSELTMRRALVDDLESLVDLLLAMGDTAVVVIDDRRRISGLSRVAAERLDGAALGKPLSSVLPAPIVDELTEGLDSGEAGQIDLPVAGSGACVQPLPGGGAVLVLPSS
jgi:hypothetical protein